ncbi:hypothetical protein [Cupriavidus sp. YAF13]
MLLIKNGVPYDVAFSYTAEERFAACVVMREFDGEKFDWEAMAFRERG